MAEYILRDQAIIAVTGAKLPDVSASGLPIANGKRSVTDCVRRLKEIPAADVRPVKWTLCEEKQPPQGRYLCVKQLFNGDFSYDVCSFAEDLSKVDKYGFPKNLYKGIGGWFDYDETGYFQTSVYAWMPLPPFYNCWARMEES